MCINIESKVEAKTHIICKLFDNLLKNSMKVKRKKLQLLTILQKKNVLNHRGGGWGWGRELKYSLSNKHLEYNQKKIFFT